MTSRSDVPVDLYVATYSDADAAQEDWVDIKQLATEKMITVDALVLVGRDADGRFHEQDNARTAGVATVQGAEGGLRIGQFVPPALVASTEVGARAGGLVTHHEKREIKAEVASDLPFGSSGILVLLDERWGGHAEMALSRADRVSKHKIDRQSIEQAKTEASKPSPTAIA